MANPPSCSALLVEMVSLTLRLSEIAEEIDDIIKDSLIPAVQREDTIARLLDYADEIRQRKKAAKSEFDQACRL